MSKKRYAYVGNDCVKCFKNFKQMQAFAIDKAHDGTYYISCTDITFKKSREQVIGTKGA